MSILHGGAVKPSLVILVLCGIAFIGLIWLVASMVARDSRMKKMKGLQDEAIAALEAGGRAFPWRRIRYAPLGFKFGRFDFYPCEARAILVFESAGIRIVGKTLSGCSLDLYCADAGLNPRWQITPSFYRAARAWIAIKAENQQHLLCAEGDFPHSRPERGLDDPAILEISQDLFDMITAHAAKPVTAVQQEIEVSR